MPVARKPTPGRSLELLHIKVSQCRYKKKTTKINSSRAGFHERCESAWIWHTIYYIRLCICMYVYIHIRTIDKCYHVNKNISWLQFYAFMTLNSYVLTQALTHAQKLPGTLSLPSTGCGGGGGSVSRWASEWVRVRMESLNKNNAMHTFRITRAPIH